MRILLILLLLLLPASAQTAEQLLREGNFPAAASQATPGTRTWALAQLGLGRTGVALATAEKLLEKPGNEALALEMLAVTAAYLDARPRRVDAHLARLDKLLEGQSGPYADYARFLTLSYRFDLDLNRNPQMPTSEIVRRHQEAWSLIDGLGPDERFTSELFWLTDVYNHAWLAVVLQTKREEASQVIGAARMLDDALRVKTAPLPTIGMMLTVAGLAGSQEWRQTAAERLAKWPDATGYVSGLRAELATQEGKGVEATSYALASGNLETLLSITLARVDNEPSQARQILAQAMQAPGFLSTRRNQIWAYYYLARMESGPAAISAYTKSIEALEGYIAEMGGGSIDQIRAEFAPIYEGLAREQLIAGQNGAGFETLGRWDQVQSSQGFSLDDLKQREPELVTRAQAQKDEVSNQESQLMALQISNAPAGEVQRASRLLAQTRESYYHTMMELEKRDPVFRKLDIKPVNFSKLQRAIPKNTLVLQMFPADDMLYLIEATTENLVVREVAVKREELDALVRAVRAQIAQFSRDPGPFDWSTGQALGSPLEKLYGLLIAPAQPEMADKEVVALIPYGSLLYLPFQALRSPDGQFLIQQKQLVVLCKATDLDQVYGPPSSTSGTLVAFGNPDLTLPGASQEVTALKRLFPDATVFLEGQATTDKMAQVQAPRVSFLHLATHGHLNPQDSRASYLTMAGGKLSVPDIAGRNLDNPATGDDLCLVTLSACQTALAGREATGSDLRTLADAFSLAGCRSMVASLWRVSDESTRDLMVAFYGELKAGKPKALAMQQAEVKLLQDARYTHPFYWAPFILIGDWR